jgi:hypothetical protein
MENGVTKFVKIYAYGARYSFLDKNLSRNSAPGALDNTKNEKKRKKA